MPQATTGSSCTKSLLPVRRPYGERNEFFLGHLSLEPKKAKPKLQTDSNSFL